MKQIVKQVKEHLENKYNIEFGEYYGNSLIYNGNNFNAEPKEVRQWFESYNAGHYTVQIFRIPDDFKKIELNVEKINNFLNKS